MSVEYDPRGWHAGKVHGGVFTRPTMPSRRREDPTAVRRDEFPMDNRVHDASSLCAHLQIDRAASGGNILIKRYCKIAPTEDCVE